MKYILASKSPRRRELLAKIISDFDIVVRDVDESLPNGLHPVFGVELLAVRKGEPVARDNSDAVVISSDTLVELDGIPLGKPESEEDAARMLRSLSGRWHNVHTGVAVHHNGALRSGVFTSKVRFKELSGREISDYIATREPMDKAGAYGIQGLGGALVECYEGDFDTIVGLPIVLTERLIKEVLSNE